MHQGSTTLVAMLDKYLFIHSLATRFGAKKCYEKLVNKYMLNDFVHLKVLVIL